MSKVTIRTVLVEWLQTKIGKVIGTHEIEELKRYALERYELMVNVESLSRDFRKFREDKAYLEYGLDIIELKTDSRENKYLIENSTVNKNLFGEAI